MNPQGVALRLLARDDGNQNAGKELLDLLKDPFASTLAAASIFSALAISLGVTGFIAIAFSLLRPYNQAVYAPKMKHADEKHAPPPIGRKPWSWITVLFTTHEEALVHQVGMDATIFLRFVRMCRNMFLVLAVVGAGILIPINYTKSVTDFGSSSSKRADSTDVHDWTLRITPLNVYNSSNWAQVVVAWLFDIIVAGFLWWNYRKIVHLRRKYFESEEYQHSLHSRTLMLCDLPKQACSDEGIARIIDEVVPNSSFARTAVARNVKDLPSLITEHDHTVRKLEKVLAKYLKNPQQLPPGRPMCKPSKKDRSFESYPRGQKVDAIEYLTQRIRDLEVEIKEVRASVDKRSVMPYGFASYSDITEAHNIAYAMRKKKPQGATVALAPRPNDIIWANMSKSVAARNRRKWINALWVILLTVLWIAPNAMIAVFLVNFSNLGAVWKGFKKELAANPKLWGVIQGIASPALMSLVYLVLPIIFRRLSIKAGDQTKTGRERHVLGKLFAFFVFNNLIVFSLFSTIWSYVAGIIDKTTDWHDFEKLANALFISLCLNGPFWVTYLLQRQLGAAVDLSQVWTLIYASCLKRFSSPTPRELIELTAPPPFEYAMYYNYFLFYATVTLCFSGYQPLVLLATALYFTIDSYLKKYLILYVFVTKTESGGQFWRVIFNRFVFGTVLANFFVLLIVWVHGDGQHIQFYATCPLPFLMIAFKFYCRNAFDNKIRYYSTRNITKGPEAGMHKERQGRSERLASRFGNPALYRPLITPMVHQKAQNLLPAVYKGRLTDGREAGSDDLMSVSGYSDMYALNAMQGGKPGKAAGGVPGFEFVSENHLDFEYYKGRAEFSEEHGGGEIYGGAGDIPRSGTPGSYGDGTDSRPGTPLSGRATPFGGPRRAMTGGSEMGYQAFRAPAPVGFTQQATMGSGSDAPSRKGTPMYAQDNSSSSGLVRNAAGFASAGPHSRDVSLERGRMTPAVTPPGGPSIGALGGGPRGYSGLAQSDEVDADAAPAQYDYFRGSARSRRNPGEGW